MLLSSVVFAHDGVGANRNMTLPAVGPVQMVMHHLQGEKQQFLQTAAALTSPQSLVYLTLTWSWREVEGHPALLTSVTPPLRKYGCRDLWQPHTTTQNIRELWPSTACMRKRQQSDGGK